MNYKQIALSLITLTLAIYIPLATAYAQKAKTMPATVEDITPTTAPTSVDYQLPYPGMLPDNPLYFLKVIRDNLTSFFLSKPVDKANFYLLQSDKNVEASYLIATQQPGQTALALGTFSQAQDDFAQALSQATSAKKQGYSTNDIVKKLASANQKHVQLLQVVAQQTNQMHSQQVQQERSRAAVFAKEIKSL